VRACAAAVWGVVDGDGERAGGRAGRYRRYTEYLVAAASAIVRQGRARRHRVTLTRLVYLDHVWLVAGHHV